MVVVGLFGFAYFSTQSVMRLRADPPAEFADSNVSPEFRDAEAQLARAYWNSAVHELQRIYKFHAALPDEPPPDFRIQPEDAVSTYSKIYVDASRGRYWQRLRSIWDNPQTWEKSYEWNSGWIASPLKSLGQMMRR
jgi:hypothetical protein